MTKCWMVAIMLAAASPAFADNVKGDPAAVLVRALKYAGVKPSTPTKGERMFQADDIHCAGTLDTDKDLGDYKCTVDKRVIKDSAAYLLQMSLEIVGIKSTDANLQHTTDAGGVLCFVDPTRSGGDKFRCTWGVVIRPKTTPKDVVQPVKIEKQETQ